MFESFNLKNEKSEIESKQEINKESVSEINLPNLDVSDLIKLQEMIDLKEYILAMSFDIYQKFQDRLETFFRETEDAYSEEDLRKTALINLLKGDDIPADVENLDLEGEYSVQEFLQGLLNELEEGGL